MWLGEFDGEHTTSIEPPGAPAGRHVVQGLHSMSNRDIIVTGGSSGATFPLKTILSALPPNLPAAVFIRTSHPGSQPWSACDRDLSGSSPASPSPTRPGVARYQSWVNIETWLTGRERVCRHFILQRSHKAHNFRSSTFARLLAELAFMVAGSSPTGPTTSFAAI